MAHILNEDLIPLSECQKNFAIVLQEHVFVEKAAKACGLDEDTAKKWVTMPAFKWELERLRQQAATYLIMVLEKHAHKAVVKLAELLESKSETTRFRAANSILDKVIPFAEHFDLKKGIHELKIITADMKGQCNTRAQA